MKKEWVVYRIWHIASGKSYIGMTGNWKERESHHSKHKGNGCPDLYRSIRKYGWDAFKWEILETCETGIKCCERETALIEKWNTFNGFGYNMTPGGGGIIGEPREKVFFLLNGCGLKRKKVTIFTKSTGIDLSPIHAPSIFKIYIDGVGLYIDSTDGDYFQDQLYFLLYDAQSPLHKIIKYRMSDVKVEVLEYTVKEKLLINKIKHIKENDSINNGWNAGKDLLSNEHSDLIEQLRKYFDDREIEEINNDESLSESSKKKKIRDRNIYGVRGLFGSVIGYGAKPL